MKKAIHRFTFIKILKIHSCKVKSFPSMYNDKQQVCLFSSPQTTLNYFLLLFF